LVTTIVQMRRGAAAQQTACGTSESGIGRTDGVMNHTFRETSGKAGTTTLHQG
jgi:hypothetical protein